MGRKRKPFGRTETKEFRKSVGMKPGERFHKAKPKYVVSWLSDIGEPHQSELFSNKKDAEEFFGELSNDSTVLFPSFEEIKPHVKRKQLRSVS